MTKPEITLIEQRKERIIKKLRCLHDLELLESIELLLINSETDWWHSISLSERQAIDIGLEDIKSGRLFSHEQVMRELKDKI